MNSKRSKSAHHRILRNGQKRDRVGQKNGQIFWAKNRLQKSFSLSELQELELILQLPEEKIFLQFAPSQALRVENLLMLSKLDSESKCLC